VLKWKWFLFGGAVILILFGALYLASITIIVPRLIDSTRLRTEEYLSKRFSSSVEIAAFHLRVFPSIRVEADGIVLRHHGRTDIPPLIEIASATFGANFEGLLGSKVDIRSIQLKGLRVNMPPRKAGGRPMFERTSLNLAEEYPVVIHEILADDVVLSILRDQTHSQNPPQQFEIHALRLENFSFDRPASFRAVVTNPKPRGLIHCAGEFGPWKADDPSQTPVNGAYTFQDADMSTIKGLKGIMQSTGRYEGPLDYLNVEGETQIPDFALRTSAHPMDLHTDFSAIVDGTNGDTILKDVTARFLKTSLSVHGEVVDLDHKVKGRTIELYTASEQAHIEDLLTLAVNTSPPAMTGPISLSARIDIPEANTDLIERMRLDGRFAVGDMQFTNPSTQSKIDKLSRRAQGQPKNSDIAREPSKLRGKFSMAHSAVDVSNLVFAVDGATVNLAGTYQMDSGQLDFRGHLKMDAKLSQTTSGIKSLFLKAVNPFFEKHGAGTDLPIKITGTKDHPSYGLDFHDKNNKETGEAQ
jgi:AsmA-like C-terminal region